MKRAFSTLLTLSTGALLVQAYEIDCSSVLPMLLPWKYVQLLATGLTVRLRSLTSGLVAPSAPAASVQTSARTTGLLLSRTERRVVHVWPVVLNSRDDDSSKYIGGVEPVRIVSSDSRPKPCCVFGAAPTVTTGDTARS